MAPLYAGPSPACWGRAVHRFCPKVRHVVAFGGFQSHGSWRTMVPRGAPQSPQARVGLLSKSGGLSLTCLGVWCCLWGAVLFVGDLGVLGLQHLISSLRVLFGRVLFWGVGFLGCMGKMHLWSPNRNFFEWVMVTCLCVHAFLGACLCLLVWGCGHWNCVFMNSFSSTVDVCSIV